MALNKAETVIDNNLSLVGASLGSFSGTSVLKCEKMPGDQYIKCPDSKTAREFMEAVNVHGYEAALELYGLNNHWWRDPYKENPGSGDIHTYSKFIWELRQKEIEKLKEQLKEANEVLSKSVNYNICIYYQGDIDTYLEKWGVDNE